MIYRFRRIDQLLGDYQELKNQEIYFAPPEDLNDAMEGFRDIFWKGDRIVWKNMLRHYIRNLEHVFGLSVILTKDEKLTQNDIPEPKLLNRFTTPEARKLHEEIASAFFAKEGIAALPDLLASRNSPIRRDELLSYFRGLHLVAVEVVSNIYHKRGFISQKYNFPNQQLLEQLIINLKTEVNHTNDLEARDPEVTDAAETLFMVTALMSQQMDLIQSYNNYQSNIPYNRLFVLSEFPRLFIQRLEKSIFPTWYSASFLGDYKNSSLWGYYGHNHKGICLEFKTNPMGDGIGLDLEVVTGGTRDKEWKKFVTQRLEKMKYHNKFPGIDFFRSIGKMTIDELKTQWYCNEAGEQSICAEHLDETKQDNWRETYWADFYKGTGIKLEEWRFEEEYRLVIAGGFIDYSSKEKRKLKYKFEDLNGIIFGINTPTENKHRIIEVIEKKCKETGRNDFVFYQAFYSKKKGTIEKYPMNLLKFS